MSDLPFVATGDPRSRSAGLFNQLINAARKSQTIDLRSKQPIDTRFAPQDTIRVLNDTGASITGLYAIVGLIEPIFLPDASNAAEQTFTQTPCFKIEYPCTDTYQKRWAVLQQPLDDGRIGVAILSGMSVCLVDENVVAGDMVEVDQSARQHDSSLSVSSSGSAICLWSGSGTGLPEHTKWGLIRLGAGGGGGEITLRHAVVRRVCNAECGLYEVEFVNRTFSQECAGTGTGSGS